MSSLSLHMRGGCAPGEQSQPIPDQPLYINKLLKSVQIDRLMTLVEVLKVMKLNDSSITEYVRRQDEATENVRALKAGISHKLSRSYKLAMKSTELWIGKMLVTKRSVCCKQ